MTDYTSQGHPKTVFWWKEPRNEAHGAVCAAVRYLDEIQAYNSALNFHHLRMYSSYTAQNLNERYGVVTLPLQNTLKLNVIQSVVETATAMIGSNNPRVMNLTDGGKSKQQKRAKLLTQLTDAQFYRVHQHQLSERIFRDACILGTGIQKIYRQRDREKAKRVFPDDLLCDVREARMGHPRNMFEYREVDRNVLGDLYPKKRAEIKEAANDIRVHALSHTGLNDMVSVVEAYHLPSGPDAKDGRKIICISNATLLDEPWEYSYFPYLEFRWGQRPLYFWGWGLAEQLSGIQIEINFLMQKIQRSMTLASSQIWASAGSIINKQNLNNEDWAIREYTGQPPLLLPVAPIAAEFFQHVDRLYNRAFEISGVSQLQAQSVKPAGLNSGVALDTYNDLQTQRFQHVGRAWEQFHVRAALQLRDVAREIYEDTGKYSILGMSKSGTAEVIDWEEAELDEDECMTIPYPTSFFPKTPAGKLNTVAQMLQLGIIDTKEASSLFDYPDYTAVSALHNAPNDYLAMIVDDILEKGVPHVPVPEMDIVKAIPYVQASILRASRADDADEDRIQLLRDYLGQMLVMIRPPTPQPQAPMAPPGPPMGGPMPMPGPAPMPGPEAGLPPMGGIQ